jgi:hypothetical protein
VLLDRKEGQHFCNHHTFCFRQIPFYHILPSRASLRQPVCVEAELAASAACSKKPQGPYLSGPAKHEPRRGQRSTCGTSGMTIISWIEKAGRGVHDGIS